MTFAEHAVAQVLREVAATLKDEANEVCTIADVAHILRCIANRLSPKPPGEK